MEIQLFNYYRSSASFRVRIALNYKGLPFEYKAINLIKGEQRLPAYREVNPSGEVPALLHNGQVFSQSVAIIEYLDEVFLKNPLYPKDPVEKSQVRLLCETMNCLQPLQNLKVLQYLEGPMQQTEEARQKWVRQWIGEAFTNFIGQIKGSSGKFCHGDSVTAADLFLVPQIFTASRFKVDFAQIPQLMKIFENCMQLDAFVKSHPAKQPDTPDDQKAKFPF